jgi:hypothetical protein
MCVRVATAFSTLPLYLLSPKFVSPFSLAIAQNVLITKQENSTTNGSLKFVVGEGGESTGHSNCLLLWLLALESSSDHVKATEQ